MQNEKKDQPDKMPSAIEYPIYKFHHGKLKQTV